ncbi:MAG: DAK2 domain-containing protein [Acidimicrobiales bacterium]
MGDPAQLTPVTFSKTMELFCAALARHEESINRLNVFPVPDGDTGTNMRLTLEAVVDELAPLSDGASMSDVCSAVAHGSLMGARGNSGVILSQLLRGIGQRFTGADTVGPGELFAGLKDAAVAAAEAIVTPVEGTILTVARGAGDAAHAAFVAGGDLMSTAVAARDGALSALEATTSMLPALEAAGVVDAGGAGYLLFLDALLSALDGRPLPEPSASKTPPAPIGPIAPAAASDHGPRYEVMYLLDAPDDAIADFKEVWGGLGDSIVVVGGDGTWNCHIHTDDVGGAIEVALDCGRPHHIRVTDLSEQIEEERWVVEPRGGQPATTQGPPPKTEVVAVVAGEGLGRILRSLGVRHLVHGGQSMNPSVAEILELVDSLPAEAVILLPNNKNIAPVASAVQELSRKSVRVVPTTSVVQGFAALLAYDPGSGVQENLSAMSASASRVVVGEVARAVRDAPSAAGQVKAGDWVGLFDDTVRSVASSPSGAACALLEVLVQRAELVTVIEGDGSSARETRRISEWLHEHAPDAGVEIHHGGQPLYAYLFGIE